MFGEKAVCPDGLFVPAIFQESDFYLSSLIWYVGFEVLGLPLATHAKGKKLCVTCGSGPPPPPPPLFCADEKKKK